MTEDRHLMTAGPPNLAREIFAAAAVVIRVIAVIAASLLAVFAILWPLRNNPAAVVSVFYGLLFVALTVFLGWQNWKWKKRDFEREREREMRDAARKERISEPERRRQ